MDNMAEVLGKKYNIVIYYKQKKWIRCHLDIEVTVNEEKTTCHYSCINYLSCRRGILYDKMD